MRSSESSESSESSHPSSESSELRVCEKIERERVCERERGRLREKESPRFPPGTSLSPSWFEARVVVVPMVFDEIIGSDQMYAIYCFGSHYRFPVQNHYVPVRIQTWFPVPVRFPVRIQTWFPVPVRKRSVQVVPVRKHRTGQDVVSP